jgi:hypothetical protein
VVVGHVDAVRDGRVLQAPADRELVQTVREPVVVDAVQQVMPPGVGRERAKRRGRQSDRENDYEQTSCELRLQWFLPPSGRCITAMLDQSARRKTVLTRI